MSPIHRHIGPTIRVPVWEPYDIYIGRGYDPQTTVSATNTPARPGIHGNPYSHFRHIKNTIWVPDRATAVRRHREDILTNPELFNRIKLEMTGKRLGCWCKKGELCHGDTYVLICEGKLHLRTP